ncbi:MAG: hypothetical protein M5U28_38000 [Sandaracinaceae bacterium]|nr:hypothetical protein [Sandaracinaceae bacterium]
MQRPTTDAVTVRWESRLAPDPVGIDVEPEGGGELLTFTGTGRETTTTVSYGIGERIVREPDVPGPTTSTRWR